MSGEKFYDRPFDQRFDRMGDEAEGVFEQVWPRGWTRFGLDRPPIQMYRLPLELRYTPDYLTSYELMEVQGFGNDRLLKIKDEKLSALNGWAQWLQFPVRFFLWDRTTSKWAVADLEAVIEATDGMPRLTYPEGKQYTATHVDDIPISEGWHGHAVA